MIGIMMLDSTSVKMSDGCAGPVSIADGTVVELPPAPELQQAS